MTLQEISNGTDNANIRCLDNHSVRILRNFYQNLHDTLSKDWHTQFMHWRNKQELLTLLQNHNTDLSDGKKHFFWLFDKNNHLFGTSFLQICDTENADLLEREFPESPINFFEENPNAKIAILWWDGVDPDKWGKWRNRKMVEYRCQLAQKNNCDYAVSIVDLRNKQNISPYLKNNFFVAWIGKDPSDGGDIIYLVRDLKTDKKRTSPIIPQYWYYSKRTENLFYPLKAA